MGVGERRQDDDDREIYENHETHENGYYARYSNDYSFYREQ